MRTNDQGLTYAEWLAAATQGGKHREIAEKLYSAQALPMATLKKAWLAGEDPTEWARHFENETAKGSK